MSPIRLALCDRQTLLRSALERILTEEGDVEVLWSVGALAEALPLSQERTPDLLLLDFTAPTISFIGEVNRFRLVCPSVHIIAMTDHGSDICVLFRDSEPTLTVGQPRTCCLQQAFMIGARGAIRKTGTREELMRVLRAVHLGRIAVEEPSLSLLLTRIFGQSQALGNHPRLTEREQDVIRALALGKTNKDIALALDIREQTVKNHISHILEKLGLEDRLQIVVFAARHHLVTLDNL